MTKRSYKRAELKVGVEIHQRLDTSEKLFCSCPPRITNKKTLKKIKRKMRAVPGEMGEVDPAALHEFLRDRNYIYHVYPDNCLVEEDEEPPHEINRQALDISLQVAKLLNCEIPDEIHVMRKIVIDGSNTSGFQRTAIVGMDGYIRTSFGKVGIENISLEEESAKIISKKGNATEYGLDRLGIPLVEIGTRPGARTPQQARELAEKLGMVLRSVKVQRGLGTIRQDVNVSVKGGTRVEIKGLQDLKNMEKVVELEAKRQKSLLEIKKEFGRIGIEEKNYGLKLTNFSDLIEKDVGGKKLRKELEEYVGSFGGKVSVVKRKPDVIIKTDAPKKLLERLEQMRKGVPKETRSANPDGTTGYARPLPGGGRMYPETDIPPVKPDKDVEKPELIEDKKERFMKLGLSHEMAKAIVKSEYLNIFESAIEKGASARKSVNILVSIVKNLNREGVKTEKILEHDLEKVLMKSKNLSERSIREILSSLAKGKKLKNIMNRFEGLGENELDKIIREEIDKRRNMVKEEGEKSFKKLMGPVMSRVQGKVPGEKVSKKLKEEIERIVKK